MRERFLNAPTFEQYLETVQKNEQLWTGVHARAAVPEELVRAAGEIPGNWHLLALTEDWCGDAVNLLPVVARLAEAAPNIDLRVLERDENLDLMDAHLTNGRSRSIPIVIVYDENFVERGWWGPRPEPIQEWVMEEGLRLDKDTRYKHVRRYYAKDRGRTTVEELLGLLEEASDAVSA